ncbi:hypothetical protein G6F63_014592 [Rhizopus arrhizus]|nr:hypothetical protein G6F63_014592 [Rhizopus arrhizus]KAG1389308.1 hypothetical protein G6F59_015596 [Rhizopus arrhizus]
MGGVAAQQPAHGTAAAGPARRRTGDRAAGHAHRCTRSQQHRAPVEHRLPVHLAGSPAGGGAGGAGHPGPGRLWQGRTGAGAVRRRPRPGRCQGNGGCTGGDSRPARRCPPVPSRDAAGAG